VGERLIDQQSLRLLHIKIQRHVVKTMGTENRHTEKHLSEQRSGRHCVNESNALYPQHFKTAFREQNPGTADNNHSEGTKLRELANQKDQETLLE